MRVPNLFVIFLATALLGACAGVDAVQEQSGDLVLDQRAQVLQMLPDNTAAVVVVDNPVQVIGELVSLYETNATGEVEPWTIVKTFFGMSQGMDDTGVVAAGVVPPSDSCDGAAYFIVPVADWQAFMNNWGLTTLEGGAQISLMFESATLTRVGDYGFIQTGQLECLSPAVTNEWLEAATGHTARIIEDSAAVVLVNAPAAEPFIIDSIANMRQMFSTDLMMPPETTGVGEYLEIMELYLDAAERVVQDTELGVFGLDLTSRELMLEGAAQFTVGSPTEEILHAPSGDSARLGELPVEPFLMAMWADMSTVDYGAILEAARGRVSGDAPSTAIIFTSMEIYLDVQHMAAAMIPTPDGDHPFAQIGIYDVADTTRFLDGLGRSMTEAQTFFDTMAETVPEEVGELGMETVHVPNAFDIDGRRVDVYQYSMTNDPIAMDDFGSKIWSAFGWDFMSSMAVDDGDRVVVVQYGDEPMLRHVMAGRDAGTSLEATDAIQSARNNGLADAPAGEIFIDVNEIFDLVNAFADEPTMAPAFPLVSAFIYSDDAEFAGRMSVPRDVATYLLHWLQSFEKNEPAFEDPMY